MDDDRAVAEEAAESWFGGGVEIEVGGLEGAVAHDLAVFAGEVADLAGLGFAWVAGGLLAAHIGVEMGESGGAVAGRRNGLDMDVVDCRRDVSARQDNGGGPVFCPWPMNGSTY